MCIAHNYYVDYKKYLQLSTGTFFGVVNFATGKSNLLLRSGNSLAATGINVIFESNHKLRS
jgi:hypothetical protein